MENEIKFFDGDIVKYPLTPCKWVGEPRYKTVLRLTVTCGGGLGGSRWFEYTTSQRAYEGLHTYRLVNGKEVQLNSMYIVKAERFYLMRVPYIHTNTNFPETMGKVQELLLLVNEKKKLQVDN